MTEKDGEGRRDIESQKRTEKTDRKGRKRLKDTEKTHANRNENEIHKINLKINHLDELPLISYLLVTRQSKER